MREAVKGDPDGPEDLEKLPNWEGGGMLKALRKASLVSVCSKGV